MRHSVRMIGRVTARSTDMTCASCRRILSYTSMLRGQRSSGVSSSCS
ncbi:hypothetical protein F0M17_16665 [Glutamicibacter sp. ZJUTW]|nr:hypothetical protein F0M17_16665 [Glutamicibacter sp. ZJUTW]